MAGLQATGRETSVPKIPDEFQGTLTLRGPVIFTEPGEEVKALRNVLEGAVAVALAA